MYPHVTQFETREERRVRKSLERLERRYLSERRASVAPWWRRGLMAGRQPICSASPMRMPSGPRT
jgi:hypothetical protein